MRNCAYTLIQGGVRRRGGNISVDFSLYVLLYYTKFMMKLKFHDFLKFKTKLTTWTVPIHNSIIRKISSLSTQGKDGPTQQCRLLTKLTNLLTSL